MDRLFALAWVAAGSSWCEQDVVQCSQLEARARAASRSRLVEVVRFDGDPIGWLVPECDARPGAVELE